MKYFTASLLRVLWVLCLTMGFSVPFSAPFGASSVALGTTRVEEQRLSKRFGVGASAGGQLAMLGVEMDVNFTESWSIGAGVGTGIDYSTLMLKSKLYISGQWVSPYFGVTLARWWSDGTKESQIGPSVLKNKFLDPGQDLAQGFDILIVSPSFGVQFMHSSGLAFYAELEYLFKLPLLQNGTYAGGGILWYF